MAQWNKNTVPVAKISGNNIALLIYTIYCTVLLWKKLIPGEWILSCKWLLCILDECWWEGSTGCSVAVESESSMKKRTLVSLLHTATLQQSCHWRNCSVLSECFAWDEILFSMADDNLATILLSLTSPLCPECILTLSWPSSLAYSVSSCLQPRRVCPSRPPHKRWLMPTEP